MATGAAPLRARGSPAHTGAVLRTASACSLHVAGSNYNAYEMACRGVVGILCACPRALSLRFQKKW